MFKQDNPISDETEQDASDPLNPKKDGLIAKIRGFLSKADKNNSEKGSELSDEFDDDDDMPLENSDSESEDSSEKIKAGIFLAVTSIAVFWFLFGMDSQESTEVPVSKDTYIAPISGNKNEVLITRFNNKAKTTTRQTTLQSINTSQTALETIELLKQGQQTLEKRLNNLNRSSDSLRGEQAGMFKAVVELHKITSSEIVDLRDGSTVSPKNNGLSYEITSASDIVSTVEKGTFIIMASGYIIQNTETSSINFVFTNPEKEKEITNLYSLNSLHGLKEITGLLAKKGNRTVERIRSLISGGASDKKINVTEYKNSLISFNEYGEIASVKKFDEKNADELYSNTTVLKKSIRYLGGFNLINGEKFKLKSGSLLRNGSLMTFEKQSTDLKLRYAEHQPNKTENSVSFVELVDYNGNAIKRFDTVMVKDMFLNQAYVSNDDGLDEEYRAVKGKIYRVSIDGSEELQGDGVIKGRMENGFLKDERVILYQISERYNDLINFVGKILEGKSGNFYKVGSELVEVKPSGALLKVADYYLSSVGNLITKSDMKVVDYIQTIRNTSKIGGKIETANYTVIIKTLDRVVITNKKTMQKDVYLNPEISFIDDEWIVLYANMYNKHDSAAKTINGENYSKAVETSPNIYNFYNSRGKLIRPQSPSFDFNKILVLKEKVTDVEKIEGDAFDYLYRINLKTGEVSADGVIGKLILKSDKNSTAKLFNKVSKEVEIANKSNKVISKTVFSLNDMINKYPNLANIRFKMRNEDEMNIVSSSSIMINNVKVAVSEGKFNSELGIFVLEVGKSVDNRMRRTLTGSMSSNRFERTIKSITNDASDYFNSTETVITLPGGKKVVGVKRAGYVTRWTSVYSEDVDLKSSLIKLTIKPFDNSSGSTSSEISIPLNSVRDMSKTMREDLTIQYNKFIKSLSKKGKSLSIQEQRETDNLKMLESELKGINDQINSITSINLTPMTTVMQDGELEIDPENLSETEDSQFAFDIGTRLTYEIAKSIEVVQGVDSLIYTELDQTFIEDREGNTLSMMNPIIVLKVVGDFNTNKVKFYPVQFVYTDDERKRKVINIPDTATVNEYEDETSDDLLDGAPAFYVNQRVSGLGTTVALSAVQGVVESMTTPDDGFGGALSGLTDTTTTEGDAFTDGIASGASSGIQEILDSMKEKTQGKKDLLITVGGLKMTSVFITTQPVSIK